MNVLENRLKFVRLGEKHQVGLVLADHRLVRRNDDHFKTVDLLELEGLGVGGARHSGQLRIQPEKILKRDRRDGLVLFPNLHAFLRFDGLMQTIGPAPPLHGAAGEFVDDDDFAQTHDVFHVALVESVRPQRSVQVMHQPNVGGIVKTLAFAQQPDFRHQIFDFLMSVLGERGLLGLLVHRIITGTVFLFLFHEPWDQGVDLDIELGALLGGTGNDQRRTSLVDQNRVHFVDDGEGQLALGTILQTKREVVAQIIESEFVIGTVRDVAGVGGTLLVRGLRILDDAHVEAQKAEDRAHPIRVALR